MTGFTLFDVIQIRAVKDLVPDLSGHYTKCLAKWIADRNLLDQVLE